MRRERVQRRGPNDLLFSRRTGEPFRESKLPTRVVQPGGLDPTVARFDGEGSIGVRLAGGTGINKMDVAPIRYVRGWGPFDPGTKPTTDGGSAPNGRRWS